MIPNISDSQPGLGRPGSEAPRRRPGRPRHQLEPPDSESLRVNLKFKRSSMLVTRTATARPGRGRGGPPAAGATRPELLVVGFSRSSSSARSLFQSPSHFRDAGTSSRPDSYRPGTAARPGSTPSLSRIPPSHESVGPPAAPARPQAAPGPGPAVSESAAAAAAAKLVTRPARPGAAQSRWTVVGGLSLSAGAACAGCHAARPCGSANSLALAGGPAAAASRPGRRPPPVTVWLKPNAGVRGRHRRLNPGSESG